MVHAQVPEGVAQLQPAWTAPHDQEWVGAGWEGLLAFGNRR